MREYKHRAELVVVWLMSLLLAGCLPWLVKYRPDIDGAVVDPQGRPVRGARVEVCSEVNSDTLDVPAYVVDYTACDVRARGRTDQQGRFTFPVLRRWEIHHLLAERHDPVDTPHTTLLVCGAEVAGGAYLSYRDYERARKLKIEVESLVAVKGQQASDPAWREVCSATAGKP